MNINLKITNPKHQMMQPQKPPAPTPPKEDVFEKPVSTPEPKVMKPSATSKTDRVFASSLARKLAEDNNTWKATKT